MVLTQTLIQSVQNSTSKLFYRSILRKGKLMHLDSFILLLFYMSGLQKKIITSSSEAYVTQWTLGDAFYLELVKNENLEKSIEIPQQLKKRWKLKSRVIPEIILFAQV